MKKQVANPYDRNKVLYAISIPTILLLLIVGIASHFQTTLSASAKKLSMLEAKPSAYVLMDKSYGYDPETCEAIGAVHLVGTVLMKPVIKGNMIYSAECGECFPLKNAAKFLPAIWQVRVETGASVYNIDVTSNTTLIRKTRFILRQGTYVFGPTRTTGSWLVITDLNLTRLDRLGPSQTGRTYAIQTTDLTLIKDDEPNPWPEFRAKPYTPVYLKRTNEEVNEIVAFLPAGMTVRGAKNWENDHRYLVVTDKNLPWPGLPPEDRVPSNPLFLIPLDCLERTNAMPVATANGLPG